MRLKKTVISQSILPLFKQSAENNFGSCSRICLAKEICDLLTSCSAVMICCFRPLTSKMFHFKLHFHGIFHLKNLQTLSLAYIWTLSPNYLMFPWQTEHLLYLHYSLNPLCQLWDPCTLILDLPVISAASNHFPTKCICPKSTIFKIKYYLFHEDLSGCTWQQEIFPWSERLQVLTASPRSGHHFTTCRILVSVFCSYSLPIKAGTSMYFMYRYLHIASVTITGQDGWSIDLQMFSSCDI